MQKIKKIFIISYAILLLLYWINIGQAKPVKINKLKITSTPSKAAIIINNKTYKHTPTEVILPDGKYKIILKLEGYNNKNQNIELYKNQAIHFNLSKDNPNNPNSENNKKPDTIVPNNRTLAGYSAQIIPVKKIQYCPWHIANFKRSETGLWDVKGISAVLDFNIGILQRVNITVSAYDFNGFKINYLKSDVFLFSSGIFIKYPYNKLYEISIPQYFQFRLNNKSSINFNIRPTFYKWNKISPVDKMRLGLRNLYLDFESFITSNIQYILFTGIVPYELGVNETHYLAGIGLRGVGEKVKLQLGVDFLNPSIFSGIWFDF